MMPHEPVLDIMRRTMRNLSFIETHASETGPFEVTQLINSFMGAMAHPWEQLKTELVSISIDDATRQGWPQVSKEMACHQEPQFLGDLIRLIRNAIAHGNITYLPDGKGHIAALRIKNKNRQRTTWTAIITPADMRRFLECFVQLVEEMECLDNRRSTQVA